MKHMHTGNEEEEENFFDLEEKSGFKSSLSSKKKSLKSKIIKK
jgi:hypothetical protein